VRPEFRLDNFVVGPCNQLAFAAVKDVIASARPAFNPLFLHGPIGVGKTHLLHGIYNEVREAKPDLNVRYASAERFTNQYVYALKNHRLDSFRHMYRDADMLLIDDVQFFSNKMGFQEEFLHTFNSIAGRNHCVVMASDSHPHDLAKIHDGLASRFVAGMVARLEPPQYSTRLAILKAKAASFKKEIDEEVFKLIANLCQGNVRDLEGALTTVIACAGLSGIKVDLALAKEALHRVRTPRVGPITLESVEGLVLQEFGLMRESLQARKRVRSVSLPRQICMYLARKWTGVSAQEIGAYFGGRNHTTVLFATKKIEKALKADEQVAYRIHRIERQLSAGQRAS
jgi:chromosomal replication initiator protein